jgi:hypothetical protein
VVAEVRVRDLAVAAGLFRRRLLLVPVAAVIEIEPDRKRLVLVYDPTVVAIREHAEGDVVEVGRPRAAHLDELARRLDSIESALSAGERP